MGQKKILAFSGSNSTKSINKKLVLFTISLFEGIESRVVNIQDYEMPIFGVDIEKVHGIPKLAFDFKKLIKEADGILMSLAEHNGAYTAAFKNLFDWISRTEGGAWEEKPIFLMGTSNGKRGAQSVIQIAENRFPFNNGKVITTYSLPFFKTYFSDHQGIVNEEKMIELQGKVRIFTESI